MPNTCQGEESVQEIVALLRRFLKEHPGLRVDDLAPNGKARQEWVDWLQTMSC